MKKKEHQTVKKGTGGEVLWCIVGRGRGWETEVGGEGGEGGGAQPKSLLG